MIRSIIFFLSAIVLFPVTSNLAEIHYFNTSVLGKSITENICLLENSSEAEQEKIEPKIIQLDTDEGIYVASSVYYSSQKISFEGLVTQINKKYPDQKYYKVSTDDYKVWRLEKEKFVISLSSEQEDGYFRLIYIKFMSMDKTL